MADVGSKLRVATLDDAASLSRVHVAAWLETYTGILPDQMLARLSTEARASMWKRILADTASRPQVLVSEKDGQIVGFGCCGAQRSGSWRERDLTLIEVAYGWPDLRRFTSDRGPRSRN